MFTKNSFILLYLLTLAMLLSGCRYREGFFTGDRLKVIATTTFVADMVKNIGGNKAEVITLMGAGIDPHLYKASENDIIRIMESDVIFYSGLHLEGKMQTVFGKMKKRKFKTFAVTDGIDKRQLITTDEKTGQHDPHFWFSISAWKDASRYVHGILCSLDSLNSMVYNQNLESYLSRLDSLDLWIREEIGKIPQNQKVLITAHDAFNYFGRDYGIEVIGLQGLNTSAEAGVRDVQNLARLITQRRIKSIFVETSVSHRNVEALQEAVKSKGFSMSIGGELFSDSLGDEDSATGTYIGMFKHNVSVIVNALK